ncbi:MAG: molybdopterin-binding protein, partial [Pseudomonadota bacterium]
MQKKSRPSGFGLIIIGTEILDGRIQDRHFENTTKSLKAHNHPLKYSMILTDEAQLILEKLKWAMSRPEPFICCGGIGSTPDDCTRQCAARAAGVPLEFHEEGLKILKRRIGWEVTEARMRLVEFPKGARLVPNPVNQIPGFSIANGHFLPGFPSMAEPMTEWVLETYYERGEVRVRRTLVLPGAREADLVPLMEAFIALHPDLSFSSLPKFVKGGTEVDLGINGPPKDVEAGFRDLTAELEKMGQKWEEKN